MHTYRWDQPGVPHTGWVCTQVTDLEDATHTCQMCGKEEIRYVHTIYHPVDRLTMDVGCVCVVKLTQDPVNPKRHEGRLRQRVKRRSQWLDRKWRTSRKGSLYLKIDGDHVGVYPDQSQPGHWAWWVNGTFSPYSYPDQDQAMLALFDELWPPRIRLRRPVRPVRPDGPITDKDITGYLSQLARGVAVQGSGEPAR